MLDMNDKLDNFDITTSSGDDIRLDVGEESEYLDPEAVASLCDWLRTKSNESRNEDDL